MARVWNKYPYTDFHELDMSWCVEKITDFEARLSTVEEDVETLKTNVTDLQGRMSTAEGKIAQHTHQISDIQALDRAQDVRIYRLETADIQDADMLSVVSSVQAGNTSVTVNFGRSVYQGGVETEGTDSAVIPAANSEAAGVMLPGDFQKMTKMQLQGDTVIFAGPVRGDDPTNIYDFATKSYVDSLAITGSAVVTNAIPAGTYHWNESITEVDYDSFKLYTYGKVAQVKTWIRHELDSDRSAGSAMFNIHIPSEYAGDIYENVTLYNSTDGTLIPARIQGFANDAPGTNTINMTLIPLVNVPAGKTVEAYMGFTYLIIE